MVSTCSVRASPALWRRVSSLGRQAASSAPEPVRIPGGGVNGGPALPSTLVRATHCQRWTIPCPARPHFGQRRASRSPTTATRRTWCARRGCPAAPMDSGSSALRTAWMQRPRTPDACPSGHPDRTGRVDTGRMDTGRMDTGRVDTGRPPDQLDGRPSAWRTADADRATNGVADVRTSSTATTAGRPKPRSGCSVCGARQPVTAPR